MSEVVTLTMNPSVDRSCDAERVVGERKIRCGPPRREPGGGGINVARAMSRLGEEARAVYLAGGPTGEILGGLLDQEGIRHEAVDVDDWTRENFTVIETTTNRQFLFVMPGPTIREAEWRQCLEALATMDEVPDYRVLSGSLPPGAPDDFYARVATEAREAGTRVVLDTSGAALRHAVDAGVFLVKPNPRELEQLAGRELEGEDEQEEVARSLVEDGKAEIVLVSFGAGGALLVTEEVEERISSPTVPISSRVGAGDSMVAGTMCGLIRGYEPAKAARFGVASGAAAVKTPGLELCRRADADELFERMTGESEEA
ncbi:MAG: 1-phosphofructokinase family hexose kinase [Gemmatimonadota bacterium]|nr:1-phosphofructokinase family hexose kinase [Gemmatimonadota bacterium]